MYIVPVEVKDSSIDGKGVFTKENIKKDSIVWRFTKGHDKKMTQQQFAQLDPSKQKELQRIAYLSPTTGLWVMPPDGDTACYTNHSPNSNNLNVKVDLKISDEPIFIANRDVETGEELTNNYLEFDEKTKSKSFDWL